MCAGSCGPGNLHLINGLFDANRSRVPVLAIAAHIPREEIGGGYFQETHPQQLFGECSVYCEQASVPDQVPWLLEMAMRAALQRGGVGVVVIPGEVFLDRHGHVDILVNNAGITMDKTVRKMDPQEWDHVIHVNLSGAFYASRAVLQHMLERGYGRISNISSIIGSAGGFGQANYAAAKSGMFGLTMSLALETASKGITVNTVTPGFISTDMTAAVPADALKVVARIPAGRLGEPDEVARVVEFLADPESGYITGQVYPVNGGLYM